MAFKDHFSAQSGEYARRRPRYPDALFAYLASTVVTHNRAWDCGTGNGQAAVGLAPYFDQVVATDPSANQLRNAMPRAGVAYVQARAEDSGLERASVDLATAAQAVHWFDVGRYFEEVRRVVRPGGVCAIWCYTHTHISPQVDAIVSDFYYNVVGPYWERERVYVDDGYRSLAFPFEEFQPPEFVIKLNWSLDDVLGYLGTWSPVQRYKGVHGSDPVDLIRAPLAAAWGAGDDRKRVLLPVRMRIGRNV